MASKGSIKLRVETTVMALEVSSEYEEGTHSDTYSGERAHRIHHQSDKHLRDEPNTLTELQVGPLLCLVSNAWHVMNFVKGWQMSESIMSWLIFFHFIYREVNLSWLGSLSH